MIEYVLKKQSEGVGAFASVTISISENDNQENEILLSPSAFDWLYDYHGDKTGIPNQDDFLVTGTIKGIQFALIDLSLSFQKVVVNRIYFNLVDATEEGFALAAYQAVFKANTGNPWYDRITLAIMNDMKKRLTEL